MLVVNFWNRKSNPRSFVVRHSSLWRWFSFVALAAIVCAGCGREDITVYRIPKEPPTGLASSPAANAVPAGQLPLTYQMPKGWQPQTPAGMSLASFSVADNKAELSIMTFPGEGASQLNLVNIVRQEMGLAPLSDAELAKIVEPVQIAGEKGSLIDLSRGTASPTNAAADSIMIAVVPHAGATWFFKLAGNSEAVVAQKPELLDFLKSVSFTTDAGNFAASPHGQSFASANSGSAPTQATPVATDPTSSDAGKPSWQVPVDWKEVPPTQMLLAKFIINGSDGEADVTVSSFPGDVGGLLANVNRWRRSVGLDPVGESDLDKAVSSLDVPDGKAMLVDMNGKSPKTGKDTRLVGLIWPRDGQTWFYKLMGDASVAGREKDAFLKFIQSVRYSNG